MAIKCRPNQSLEDTSVNQSLSQITDFMEVRLSRENDTYVIKQIAIFNCSPQIGLA